MPLDQSNFPPPPRWPIRGAHRAANHRRALLSSANRGLATTDCSLQLWEGEVAAAIHFSSSVLLFAAATPAAPRFAPLRSASALRIRGAAQPRVSGKPPGPEQREAADASVGQVGLN